MADFRDFLLQFVHEKALSRETTFIEDALLTWFQTKYPDRKASNIHHQLLKKTTNYPGRVSYLPPPNASDDLFFATDAEFKTFRLYRIDEDPAPYYLDRKQSGSDLVKEPISTSENALSSSVQANAILRRLLHAS